jgi:uracil-DNA glycosylase
MSHATIPASIKDAVNLADASWRPVLLAGLEAMMKADPSYLPGLAEDDYLPTGGRLFAAFIQPLGKVRYVLMGEGPYPRAESATGVCFMDGAVGSLWASDEGGGLSKPVNRATSLRNFMKMLLVAGKYLTPGETSTEHLAPIAAEARKPDSHFIHTLADLQGNLMRHGFLLLNAALAFRPHVPPVREAKAWQPLMEAVFEALLEHAARHGTKAPVLVLWGKIAGQLKAIPALERLPQQVSEHPYNLTFIANLGMQQLFGPMHLLAKAEG